MHQPSNNLIPMKSKVTDSAAVNGDTVAPPTRIVELAVKMETAGTIHLLHHPHRLLLLNPPGASLPMSHCLPTLPITVKIAV
jgi:hypothetical protein